MKPSTGDSVHSYSILTRPRHPSRAARAPQLCAAFYLDQSPGNDDSGSLVWAFSRAPCSLFSVTRTLSYDKGLIPLIPLLAPLGSAIRSSSIFFLASAGGSLDESLVDNCLLTRAGRGPGSGSLLLFDFGFPSILVEWERDGWRDEFFYEAMCEAGADVWRLFWGAHRDVLGERTCGPAGEGGR